jgi:hypothetical protein
MGCFHVIDAGFVDPVRELARAELIDQYLKRNARDLAQARRLIPGLSAEQFVQLRRGRRRRGRPKLETGQHKLTNLQMACRDYPDARALLRQVYGREASQAAILDILAEAWSDTDSTVTAQQIDTRLHKPRSRRVEATTLAREKPQAVRPGADHDPQSSD